MVLCQKPAAKFRKRYRRLLAGAQKRVSIEFEIPCNQNLEIYFKDYWNLKLR